MADLTIKPDVRNMAAEIYVDLAVRAAAVSESGVKMTASADNLAKVSFKLAEAFQHTYEELNAANLPKNQDFKVGASDIAGWTTK